MCGRYTLTSPLPFLEEWFGLNSVPPQLRELYQPRFNIAPTQPILTITGNGAERRAGFHRWGLIPHWAKDPGIGNKMINARSETVAEKPAFRTSFRRYRCLIPADGFYEWQKRDGRKIPHRFTLKAADVFALAGLWSTWQSPEGDSIQSCTILTTAANQVVAPIHERMPVILAKEHYDLWLDSQTKSDTLQTLLQPWDARDMTTQQVSTQVNSPANEGPTLIARDP